MVAALQDRRILVVEDEFLQAFEICAQLEAAGAATVGPVGAYADAEALINHNTRLDLVVLDVSLGGDFTFSLADLLSEREIPYIFTTGHSQGALPTRFAHAQYCGKPLDFARLLRLISERLHPG